MENGEITRLRKLLEDRDDAWKRFHGPTPVLEVSYWDLREKYLRAEEALRNALTLDAIRGLIEIASVDLPPIDMGEY